MSIFDTFTSALGGSGATFGKFAGVALEFVEDPAHGGLEGLLDRFRDHGLDDAVRSWIGTGKNLGITRDDIERVVGTADLGELARRAGVAPEVAATELAAVLPQLVDLLTPGGEVPGGDLLAQAFAKLKAAIGMI